MISKIITAKDGQVMVMAAVAVAVLMLATVMVYYLGETMVAKFRLAYAVDASAQAGGAFLASCLNLVVQLNWARVSATEPAHREMAKQAQIMVVASAPVLAILVATETGLRNGAAVVVPLNFLGGLAMPDLEVREPKKRWWMVWKEYMVDAQRRTRNLPYGKRFIIMGGAAVRQPLPLLSKLRDKSDRGGVMVAISESAVHGSGLVWPDFKASLVKFHAGGIGEGVDWVRNYFGEKLNQENKEKDKEKD